MSNRHATDEPGHEASGGTDHHAATDHGGDHGHDDHAHGDDESLGPLDPFAWGAGILGVGVGVAIAIAVCLALATGEVG